MIVQTLSTPWYPSHARSTQPRADHTGGPTVLVVDDCESQRELCRTILETAGYRVVEAADGVEGVVRAREVRPDVVVTDLHMPRMNGWDLVAQMKASRTLAAVPVLMVTSDIHGLTRSALEGSGLSGLLAKPFDIQMLVDMVACTLPG